MTPWTADDAARFLDALDSAAAGDLPLFRGGTELVIQEGVRVERVGEATVAFWVGLLRTVAARQGVRPLELQRGDGLFAIGVPGGPALLASRPGSGSPWRVALAPEGEAAMRIRARIPAPDGVGRAA